MVQVSGDELLVEFIEQLGLLLAEKRMRFPQAAALAERGVIEIVRLDAQAGAMWSRIRLSQASCSGVKTAPDWALSVSHSLNRSDTESAKGASTGCCSSAKRTEGHKVGKESRLRAAFDLARLRGYPERKGLFSGCHGHGFAWPCFGRSEDTATPSRDRGTQNTIHKTVAAIPSSRTASQ